MAHFVWNVALAAALSGLGVARTSRTLSNRLHITAVRKIEPQIAKFRFLAPNMVFPFLELFRSCSIPSVPTASTKAEFRDRQVPYSLAGSSENGVAEGRNKWWNPRFADARRGSVALDDVYIGLKGRLVNSSHRIILKI